MKILVVDDEPEIRQIVALKLVQANHEIVEAEDGQIAWELFQQKRFPMALVDLMMPKMNGLDLIRHIRTISSVASTYVIILSSHSERQYVLLGQQAGADDYLTKPVDLFELVTRVSLGERVLRLERRLAALDKG